MTERTWRIAPLAAEHTRGLAECHIACWREAYRDLVPPHVLAAFDVDRRAEQWERVRVRYPDSTVVVLAADTVIGFASSGPSQDEPPVAARELNAMYVRAAWYGTDVAHELMRAVLRPDTDTSLWVFEDNPRAQAFYRKYGFGLDGTRRVEAFTPAWEVRMVRTPGPISWPRRCTARRS
ncbi:GNAT family N-acetyltransferase [Nocardia blacklockiae]|uniref:GNAT family N-acetyltransferase n=1 Tax=Nocardia blacklockiae TaxID=480036 RepID=UPI001892E4FE|nr:GNAT family N-acetyltransferase [Nocardia blacklockiae]MBF6173724.1 GNAT family N-acetyltransferase [Nocardia blacklockiae]